GRDGPAARREHRPSFLLDEVPQSPGQDCEIHHPPEHLTGIAVSPFALLGSEERRREQRHPQRGEAQHPHQAATPLLSTIWMICSAKPSLPAERESLALSRSAAICSRACRNCWSARARASLTRAAWAAKALCRSTSCSR